MNTTIGTIHLFTKFGRRTIIRTTGTFSDPSVTRWLKAQASAYVFDSDLADGADLDDSVRFGIALAGLDHSRHASV